MLYMRVVQRVNPKSAHHKEKNIFSFSFILYLYDMMDVHQTYHSNHVMKYLSQIMLYTLNLCSAVCQSYLSKSGRK